MIYAFSRTLEAALQARGFPYRVRYSPFLDPKAQYGAGIVVARTRGANERVAAPVGPRRNPQQVLTRHLLADVYIFAKSSTPNARVQEHEDECDSVVDGVLTSADTIVRSAGATDFVVKAARYLSAAERAAEGGYVEQWPGVVYYLQIEIPRGVTRVTYQGNGAPEATIAGAVTNGTVRAPGATAQSFGPMVAGTAG